MTFYSLINHRRLCCDTFFKNIFNENTIGLLTAGKVVVNKDGSFKIEKITKQTLKSSEKAFP